MQTKKENTKPIATRVTETMEKAIQQVLQTDGHLNASDYVRDLIRKDLEKRGFLQEAPAI